MFCPNCSTRLSDDASFCTGCGTALLEQEAIYEAEPVRDAPVESFDPQRERMHGTPPCPKCGSYDVLYQEETHGLTPAKGHGSWVAILVLVGIAGIGSGIPYCIFFGIAALLGGIYLAYRLYSKRARALVGHCRFCGADSIINEAPENYEWN